MDEILEFLLHQASFLYKGYGCKFVDSEVSKSFGNAFLDLITEKVRFRLIRDRGQLFGDFTDVTSPLDKKIKFFSIGVVRKYLTGEMEFFDELNANNATFLQKHFLNIEKLFDPSTLIETRKQLHKLEIERSKKLFG